jgi:multiple sugar transport system substrate-binding protein
MRRSFRPRSHAALAVLGAGALLIGGTACGSTSNPGAVQGKVTITFWNDYSETDQEYNEITKVIIPKFESQNPNITVENVTLPETSENDKIIADAAGGSLPDVARVDIAWEPVFAALGVLIPENSLPGYSTIENTVFQGNLSTNRFHGQLYGLPLDTNTKVLFSNTKLLAAHGITSPPATMTQFVSDIKACTSGSGKSKVYGFMDGGGTDLWGTMPWIASEGGAVTNASLNSATGFLNGKKTIKGLDTLVSLEQQGYVTGLLPGANGDLTGLADGEYCMIDEGPWDVPTIQQTYPTLQYKMSPFPKGPGGSGEPVGGEDITVFKTGSAHQAAAWKFEQFMLSEFAQTRMQSVGQMSVLKNLPASAAAGSLSYLKVFDKQLLSAVARPPVAKYNQIDTDISNAIGLAASGKGTISSQIATILPQVNALLKQN